MQINTEKMLSMLGEIQKETSVLILDSSSWDSETNRFHLTMEMTDKQFSRMLKQMVNEHKEVYAAPFFNEFKNTIYMIIDNGLVDKLNPREMDIEDLKPFFRILDVDSIIKDFEARLHYSNNIGKYIRSFREYFKELHKMEIDYKNRRVVKDDGQVWNMTESDSINTMYMMNELEGAIEYLAANPSCYKALDMQILYAWYTRIEKYITNLELIGDPHKIASYPEKSLILAVIEQCEHLYAYHIQWSLTSDEINNHYDKNDPRFGGHTPIEYVGFALKKWTDDIQEEYFRIQTRKKAEEKAAQLVEELEKMEKLADEFAKKKLREEKWAAEGFRFERSTAVADIYSGEKGYRFLIKNRNRSDMVRTFSQMEEFGLTRGGVRKSKSEAGIIRSFKIGEDVIYSDTLIKDVFKSLKKKYLGKPWKKDEAYNIALCKTILQLAKDKVFFELSWLEEAPGRAHPETFSLKDSRRLVGIMKDLGLIGQVKKKDKKKVFALTSEGLSMVSELNDANINPVSPEWAVEIAGIIADKISGIESFDILTERVRNLEAMVEGKAPKFLGYYVSDF